MSSRPPRLPHLRPGSTAAIAALALVAMASCEGAPARSKPWRHAQDPEIMASAQTRSEVAAAEAARLETRRRRAHTMRIHMDAQTRHLNPMTTPTVWTMRVAADTVFETLIRYEPPPGGAGTGPGRYRAGLARSWSIGQGGREIRVELEPDVLFHDGKRMSSVDVQFSLDSARSPRVPADHLRAHLADVTAVEIINARTVRIRLARPNGYVLRALADVPILPAHVYQRELAAKRGPVVGTGPYRLESWQDDVIRLRRFDDYWGEAPAIRDIEFVYEPDAARALTAAKRGDIDLVPALIRAHYPEQASAPGLASAFAPLRLRPPVLRYLVMNAGKPPLDDVRVRHALALLIDRKSLIRTVYGGLARPVAGPVWPGGPGDGAAPAPPAYDPGAAGRLLDAAGWRDRDGDGVREREGQQLRLVLLARDGEEGVEQESVVRNLRRSGIQVDQRAGAAAVLRNRLDAGDFDIAFVRWRSAVDHDLSPLLETGGALDFGRFSHPRVDAALAALRAVWEPPGRAPLMRDLAQAIAETWPLAPIVAPDPYGLIHRRVRGVVVWNGWISLRDLSLAPVPADASRPAAAAEAAPAAAPEAPEE